MLRRQRHRLEDGLGDEGQRALRADDEAAEDLQRLLGVEEGAEPVAGRVLDLELAADALAQLGVGADLVADRGQAGGQLGLRGGEALGGAGCGGVDRRPRGRARRSSSARSSRSPWSTPQRIPPELLAITPPTVAMSVLAGSGPSLRPCGARTRLAWPSTVPGLTRASAPSVLDRDAAEVAAHVDQDAVALALAVEAGAAGAEGDRDAAAAAVGEDLGDVARRRGPSPPPAGRVGRGWRRRRSGRCRPARPSTRSAPSSASSSPRSGCATPAAISVRGAVGRGLCRRRRERGDVPLQQRHRCPRRAPSRAPPGLRPARAARRRAPSPARRAPRRAPWPGGR